MQFGTTVLLKKTRYEKQDLRRRLRSGEGGEEKSAKCRRSKSASKVCEYEGLFGVEKVVEMLRRESLSRMFSRVVLLKILAEAEIV